MPRRFLMSYPDAGAVLEDNGDRSEIGLSIAGSQQGWLSILEESRVLRTLFSATPTVSIHETERLKVAVYGLGVHRCIEVELKDGEGCPEQVAQYEAALAQARAYFDDGRAYNLLNHSCVTSVSRVLEHLGVPISWPSKVLPWLMDVSLTSGYGFEKREWFFELTISEQDIAHLADVEENQFSNIMRLCCYQTRATALVRLAMRHPVLRETLLNELNRTVVAKGVCSSLFQVLYSKRDSVLALLELAQVFPEFVAELQIGMASVDMGARWRGDEEIRTAYRSVVDRHGVTRPSRAEHDKRHCFSRLILQQQLTHFVNAPVGTALPAELRDHLDRCLDPRSPSLLHTLLLSGEGRIRMLYVAQQDAGLREQILNWMDRDHYVRVGLLYNNMMLSALLKLGEHNPDFADRVVDIANRHMVVSAVRAGEESKLVDTASQLVDTLKKRMGRETRFFGARPSWAVYRQARGIMGDATLPMREVVDRDLCLLDDIEWIQGSVEVSVDYYKRQFSCMNAARSAGMQRAEALLHALRRVSTPSEAVRCLHDFLSQQRYQVEGFTLLKRERKVGLGDQSFTTVLMACLSADCSVGDSHAKLADEIKAFVARYGARGASRRQFREERRNKLLDELASYADLSEVESKFSPGP